MGFWRARDNALYWDCKEDVRNTYIRDILRAKKYIVSDQTLIGKSESGKSSGELDIEVFEKWDKPLALMEALIISSDGLGDIRYWNRHLKKLLDNYNPIGIPEVYLISYVECSKDKFKELWMSNAEETNNLIVFCKTPRTRKEICDYLGLNSVTYAIQTYVNPLVEAGVIKLSIPDKPKSPKQLYYSVEREK